VAQEITMEQLLAEAPVAAMSTGDVVEGTVIAAEKHEVWLDLGPRGTGLVVGREIEHSQDINPGDVISASVLDPEDDRGYAILSLKKVAKEKGWESWKSALARVKSLPSQRLTPTRVVCSSKWTVSAAFCRSASYRPRITPACPGPTRMKSCTAECLGRQAARRSGARPEPPRQQAHFERESRQA
jgi:predicted RNA-binding protein with RPS1 domain